MREPGRRWLGAATLATLLLAGPLLPLVGGETGDSSASTQIGLPRDVSAAPDGSQLLVVSASLPLLVDPVEFRITKALTELGGGEPVAGAFLSAEEVVILNTTGVLEEWNLTSGRLVARGSPLDSPVFQSSFSPGRDRVIILTQDGALRVVDLRTLRPSAQGAILDFDGRHAYLAWHPDGAYVAVPVREGGIWGVDVLRSDDLGPVLHVVDRSFIDVRTVGFAMGGSLLVVAGEDANLGAAAHSWHFPSGDRGTTIAGAGDTSIVPLGSNRIATMNTLGLVRVWDDTGTMLEATDLGFHSGWATKMIWDPSHQRLIAICETENRLLSFAPQTDLVKRPNVRITMPVDGSTVPASLDIAGNAWGDLSVSGVWVRIDEWDWELAVGTQDWSLRVDISTLPEGTHRIQARAYAGTAFSLPVTVTVSKHQPAVQDTRPIVTIFRPSAGTSVQRPIRVDGWYDDRETPSPIALEYAVDGGVWSPIPLQIGWSFTWDPAGIGAGVHQIRVRGFDGISYSNTPSVGLVVNENLETGPGDPDRNGSGDPQTGPASVTPGSQPSLVAKPAGGTVFSETGRILALLLVLVVVVSLFAARGYHVQASRQPPTHRRQGTRRRHKL